MQETQSQRTVVAGGLHSFSGNLTPMHASENRSLEWTVTLREHGHGMVPARVRAMA